MKTITFYSYKGGVGRTLLLANVAKYLCRFGQKVFALDFDLEAPGLHYKLTPPESWKSLAGRPGVVDYVYSFVAESRRPESLQDYVMEVGRHDEVGGVIHMMRAGDVPTADYWRKLAGINWHEIFYSEGSRGIPFFLDLKARIEEEYQADYLLIDSRTGITEIGGVATTVLPDTIVCLILNNPENLEGAREVLRSIGRTRRQRSQPAVEILPVVSRLPASDDATEAGVVDSVRDALNQEAPLMEDTLALQQMLVLHREPSLESRESLLIDSGTGIDTLLFRDYLRLIARLVPPAVLAPHIVPLVRRAMDGAFDDPEKPAPGLGDASTRGLPTWAEGNLRPVDVVVVDDHRVVRDGIRAILSRDPEFRVVGEAKDGAGALRICQETNPDVVLMDISLPGVNGIEATVQLVKQFPTIKVVILSMYHDERSVMGAIRAGVRGFVLKQASFGEVLNALRVVARGGTYLSSSISARLVERLQRGSLDTQEKSPLELLTPRELQVLRLVAEGRSTMEAAAILKLEHGTVLSYRKTMMKKLGVSNVAALIAVAVGAGLVVPHSGDLPPSSLLH